ncbi:7426_t:CDS:2 [Gigaspora rosea]|nr:7426_t:CDS:2 [Gigaspora rosea]
MEGSEAMLSYHNTVYCRTVSQLWGVGSIPLSFAIVLGPVYLVLGVD